MKHSPDQLTNGSFKTVTNRCVPSLSRRCNTCSSLWAEPSLHNYTSFKTSISRSCKVRLGVDKSSLSPQDLLMSHTKSTINYNLSNNSSVSSKTKIKTLISKCRPADYNSPRDTINAKEDKSLSRVNAPDSSGGEKRMLRKWWTASPLRRVLHQQRPEMTAKKNPCI